MRHRLISKQTEVQRAADADEGIRFVLSTDDVDLSGDIVVQQGLSLAREPLPAQIDHGGGLFDLIGQWTKFEFGAHQTTAVLKLLKRGVSRAADLVRDLHEEGVQLASSIGFVPDWDQYELIRDDKNEWVTGIKFLKGTLTEASIVVTPANPQALARAKSLHPKAAGAGQSPNDDARAEILKRLQGAIAPRTAPPPKGKAMNISEQIKAAQAALNALRDKATTAAATLEKAEDGEARAALLQQIEATNTEMEVQKRTIETLQRTEAMLASRAAAAEVVDAPAVLTHSGPVMTPAKKRLMIVRHALCTFEAYVKHEPIDAVIERRYGGDPFHEATSFASKILRQAVHKAAQNPAMTSVPEWAGALVRDGYGAFMEELRVEAVVPRLPLQREEFDGFNSITVSGRSTTAPADPNLAAAFRAEGAPIRVGSASLAPKKLTPHSMGIIGTFTLELFKRSTPNIENKIHEWMITDTAVVLDGVFLGTGAAGDAPAGIANGLAAGDTAAATGNTAAAIDADTRARVAALLGHRMGRRAVWVMHSARFIGLSGVKTAAGTPLYPTLADSPPKLHGYPVEHGVDVPLTTVFLIDGAEVAFAGGAPNFTGSTEATLHEEYVQADVKPIVDGATPAVIAAPVRSLFQTYSAALRGVWELDWARLREGGVQTITGATW